MADLLRKDEGVNYVMFYNIERTLQILPGVCWAVLGIVLLFLEIKNFKESYMYFKEQKINSVSI